MSADCCSTEERPQAGASGQDRTRGQSHDHHHGHEHDPDHDQGHERDPDHDHHHGHAHDHDHGAGESGHTALAQKHPWRAFLPATVSLCLLLAGIGLDQWLGSSEFTGLRRLIFYLAAYLPVGIPVLKEALSSMLRGAVFSEFFLMSIATLGAFFIGEYPEGVAVMLFYTLGETFQGLAVRRAKNNIAALLDQRPDQVQKVVGTEVLTIAARDACIGDILRLRAGEKLALDSELLSEQAYFNTAALTGESKPDTKHRGDMVLAGMINLQTLAEVKVSTLYTDSKLSRILELVQHASRQKAPTELFIRKFARIYTPIVVGLALAICLLPALFIRPYHLNEWLYRALIFLVISCPCALVISIPLGYFGGIGAASRHGILFKGSSFLDRLAAIQDLMVDKTGTLSEGVFKVQEAVFNDNSHREHLLALVDALEAHSTHPVATAIQTYMQAQYRTNGQGNTTDITNQPGNTNGTNEMQGKPDMNERSGTYETAKIQRLKKASASLTEIEELAGYGLRALADGKILLVGNTRLLDKFAIPYPPELASLISTTIAVAYDGRFEGYIRIADQLKSDTAQSINQLHDLGIHVTLLSGDKNALVRAVAEQLHIDEAFGDLLPEDKVKKVQAKKATGQRVAFVGDGVNDAPVVALSDVGMAMGGLGSDATIETADIVIQDDRPLKIPMAIRISRQTKRIVWQNIILAFVVKATVLALGAGGLATMWEAVFADVGVALLAVLNAVRIQNMSFNAAENQATGQAAL